MTAFRHGDGRLRSIISRGRDDSDWGMPVQTTVAVIRAHGDGEQMNVEPQGESREHSGEFEFVLRHSSLLSVSVLTPFGKRWRAPEIVVTHRTHDRAQVLNMLRRLVCDPPALKAGGKNRVAIREGMRAMLRAMPGGRCMPIVIVSRASDLDGIAFGPISPAVAGYLRSRRVSAARSEEASPACRWIEMNGPLCRRCGPCKLLANTLKPRRGLPPADLGE